MILRNYLCTCEGSHHQLHQHMPHTLLHVILQLQLGVCLEFYEGLVALELHHLFNKRLDGNHLSRQLVENVDLSDAIGQHPFRV